MKDFLKKIKLIENSNLILENITIDDFRLFFNEIVITEKTEKVFENIDFFSKKKNFIGQINLNNFEIRKVVKFNGKSDSHTKAIGHFHEQDGHLKIDTNIFGSQNFLIFVYGSLVVFFYCKWRRYIFKHPRKWFNLISFFNYHLLRPFNFTIFISKMEC